MQFGCPHHNHLLQLSIGKSNAVFDGEGTTPRVYLSRVMLLSVARAATRRQRRVSSCASPSGSRLNSQEKLSKTPDSSTHNRLRRQFLAIVGPLPVNTATRMPLLSP
jgi:hypothetical protein